MDANSPFGRPDLVAETPAYVAIGIDADGKRPVLFPLKPAVASMAAGLDADRHESSDYMAASRASLISVVFHLIMGVLLHSQFLIFVCLTTALPWLAMGRILYHKHTLKSLRMLKIVHLSFFGVCLLLGLFWLVFEHNHRRRYINLAAMVLWLVQAMVQIYIVRVAVNLLYRCMMYNSTGTTCLRLREALNNPNVNFSPQAYQIARAALELDPAAKQAMASAAYNAEAAAAADVHSKMR
jgi:hypothetical protein